MKNEEIKRQNLNRVLEASAKLFFEKGIEATTMGEPLAAARGELPVTMETMPSLWVRQEDVERATAALEQLAAEAGQARLNEEPTQVAPEQLAAERDAIVALSHAVLGG